MRLEELTSTQTRELVEALTFAYPDYPALRFMVEVGLDKNLNAIASSQNILYAAFDLVQWAEAQGYLEQLIDAARAIKPQSPKLRRFAESLALAPKPEEYERIVLHSVKFVNNTDEWRSTMAEAELSVCAISINGSPRGTGFLLGPRVVITNYHVVASVIDLPAWRDKVALRFDYRTNAEGTLLQGVDYPLVDADWLLDSSPEGELDYALLRVAGQPGDQPVARLQTAPKRGWLKPLLDYKFAVGEPLAILQHPKVENASPPKSAPLSLGQGSVLRVDAVNNRVYYSSNTLEGSSGSPCFNSDWQLVALHHWGSNTANRGIPFSAILEQPKVVAALGT